RVLQWADHRRWRAARRSPRPRRAPLRDGGTALSPHSPLLVSLLDIDDVVVEIQSMPALRVFSMRLPRGVMASLVGRNVAGETTLMRTIMGHLKPARGVIRFEGADLA